MHFMAKSTVWNLHDHYPNAHQSSAPIWYTDISVSLSLLLAWISATLGIWAAEIDSDAPDGTVADGL
jgi:hypothetical protein